MFRRPLSFKKDVIKIVTSPPVKKNDKANLTICKCQQRKEFYLLQTKCHLILK